ncbi:hypothetical protein BCR32DRAFT_295528 [Anaeromyces robustus]|uniref:Uncharacterized protein n=1 Tax=Anaeromyces robustus TaxID=1754192 RepID=A0A1Y1WVM8_9FUNG|nr:hypothetical protein BCR32DRAFT_295528 [Anaeromyces robustus]|eukprot:ORX77597.1 hypothetical protein BCR32DRAFT_295528 [Anaeromyces robustus]
MDDKVAVIVFFIFIIFVLLSAVIWMACCNTCCGQMLLSSMAEKIPCLKCFVKEDFTELYPYEQVELTVQKV